MTVTQLLLKLMQMIESGDIKPSTLVSRSAGEDPLANILITDVAVGKLQMFEHYGPDFKNPPRPPKPVKQKCVVFR